MSNVPVYGEIPGQRRVGGVGAGGGVGGEPWASGELTVDDKLEWIELGA